MQLVILHGTIPYHFYEAVKDLLSGFKVEAVLDELLTLHESTELAHRIATEGYESITVISSSAKKSEFEGTCAKVESHFLMSLYRFLCVTNVKVKSYMYPKSDLTEHPSGEYLQVMHVV
jgi:hypothetical protein